MNDTWSKTQMVVFTGTNSKLLEKRGLEGYEERGVEGGKVARGEQE